MKTPYIKLSSMDDLCDCIYEEVQKQTKDNSAIIIDCKGATFFDMKNKDIHINAFQVLVGDYEDCDIDKVILNNSGHGMKPDVKMIIKRLYENPFGTLFTDDNPPFPILAYGEFCITRELFERIVARIIKEATE